jgi:integrase
MLHLERKGKSPRTIRSREWNLKTLSKRANLNDSLSVELAIARYIKRNKQPATNTYKKHLCEAYNDYCKFYNIKWEKPSYKPEERSIQPPSIETCQKIVAAAQRELSIKIDISTQTGLRPIEIVGSKGIKPKDIHPEQKTITAISTKGCNQRPPIKVTDELIARLQTHITKHNIKPDEPLFKGTPETYRGHYKRLVNNLAKKLNEPAIAHIRLYDLRHAYVTRILRKIQNVEFVRQIVGHKNLNTTQKYMHLLANTNGEWIVESTTDQKRADELLKQDFTYILTTPDGYMKFRKMK